MTSGMSLHIRFVSSAPSESVYVHLLTGLPGADVPITELSLSILKGLIHQMLDRSINHSKVQEAVLEATTKAVVLASAAAPDSHV